MVSTVKSAWKSFWSEEDGMGTLEIILILAVLVILAIAFRKWMMKWAGDLFGNTNQKIDEFKSGPDAIAPGASTP
ncbi:Flp1 family type IVb pilin [Paenibacillus thermoaerophilus]|uniref:Flp1 family type IVb pilin n=1 Tax=Paenibacillus thermoaerophilus TaxID=1215385 RepID=A0ABW2V692_9BACL|nr:Flp1 family type IVb pilin [Paenibacillus thermoaerophilus]TMV17147.1 hypothetical protein FE781_08200 [Paenibacillus thermoaerophilus]